MSENDIRPVQATDAEETSQERDIDALLQVRDEKKADKADKGPKWMRRFRALSSRTRGMIIALGVLVILGILTLIAVLIAGAVDDSKGTEYTKEELVAAYAKAVIVEQKTNLERIDVKNDYAQFGFYYDTDSGEWTIEGYEDGTLNNTAIDSLVDSTALLMSNEIVANNTDPDTLKTFGLDDPLATVDVTLRDGSVINCFVGRPSSDGEACYMYREGKDAVYLVSSDYATGYLSDLNAFWDIPTAIVNTEQLWNLSIERHDGGPSVDIELMYDDQLAYTTYRMNEPYNTAVDSYQITNFFSPLGMFTPLYIECYDPEDLSVYGLDDPTYIVMSRDNAGTQLEAYLGDKTPDGENYFMQVPNDKAVYLIATSCMTTWLETDPYQLISRFAQIYNIQNVEQITAEGPDDGFKLGIAHAPGKDKDGNDTIIETEMTCDGKPFEDEKAFRSFYSTVVGITVDGKLEEEPPKADPDYTFTFKMTNGDENIVTYVPASVNTYAVYTNDEFSGLYLESWRVKYVFEQYQALLNGELAKN